MGSPLDEGRLVGASTASETSRWRRQRHADAIAATPSPQQSKANYDAAHGLVLEVHARGPGLDHELRELHDGREAPVAGIAVRDNRSQVVDVLPGRKRPAVVVLQSLEQLVDLLRNLCGTPSRNRLRSLPRRVDSLMIMKMTSTRGGIATTPSTRVEVEKLKETTLSQHRVVRIVREVGTRLVRRRGGRRALPPRNVDRC